MRKFTNPIVLGAFILPLQQSPQWMTSTYRNIPANAVEFKNNQLQIDVKSSASPLFYLFEQNLRIKGFRVEGSVERSRPGGISVSAKDQANPKAGIKTGSNAGSNPETNFPEDSEFRLGLIEAGSRKLSFLERMFAPAWAIELERKLPRDFGVAGVHFFNMGAKTGLSRKHPSSALMTEKILWPANPQDGKLMLKHDLATSILVAGIWISSDGDDAKDAFQLRLFKVELLTEP